MPAAGLLEEGIKRSRSSYPVFKAGLESEQREADACATCVRITVTRIYYTSASDVIITWRYSVWNIGTNEDRQLDSDRRNFPASF